VTWGIRPEGFDIGPESGLPLRVSVVEPTGAATFVYGNVAGSPVCAVFDQQHTVRAGQTVLVQTRDRATHLFDAESGKTMG
jgi:multiple sugar transport system ATP-binding protein